NGSFGAPQNYTVGFGPQAVAVGDFNNDGVADLAVADASAGTVSILLGKGDGTFQAAQGYASGASGDQPQSIAVGDFNGDGAADLAVTNLLSSTVSVLLGNGNGTFQAPQGYTVGSLPYSVAVGDFNGDGIPDLAVTNYLDNTVSILLGPGDGTFKTAVSY